MAACTRALTPLQRRSIQKMCGVGVLAMLTNFSNPHLPNPLLDAVPALTALTPDPHHPSALLAGVVAVLCLLPVALAVWVAGQYLRSEPDEFIRSLVIRALLWGFAVTMAADAILGALMNFHPRPLPLGQLNADVFLLSTAIAFRLVQRSYR